MAGLPRSSSAPTRNAPPPQELLDDLCRICRKIMEHSLFSSTSYLHRAVNGHPPFGKISMNCLIRSKEGWLLGTACFPRCLLVKGWKPGSSWSFPRGKKNKDEEDHTCAVREVLEETGFDVSKHLKMEDYVEVVIGQQRVRLYIITGVKEDTVFAPLTKKEISEISWFRVDDLQPAGDDITSRGVNGLKLYMVAPFLISLKAWISAHQPSSSQRSDVPSKGTCVWKAKSTSSGSTTTTENILPRAGSGTPTDTRPGKSFRNFRFDTALIFQAMETAFAAN